VEKRRGEERRRKRRREKKGDEGRNAQESRIAITTFAEADTTIGCGTTKSRGYLWRGHMEVVPWGCLAFGRPVIPRVKSFMDPRCNRKIDATTNSEVKRTSAVERRKESVSKGEKREAGA